MIGSSGAAPASAPAAQIAHQLMLAYETLALRVRSDEPAALAWLAEFLSPQFALLDDVRGRADEVVIELVHDAAAFASARSAGSIPGRPAIDGFALDNSVIPLLPWSDPHAGRVFFEERLGVFLRFADGDRRVRILAAPGNLGARTALMRVAREIAMHHAHAEGGFFLHASGVAFGDRGLVVAGPKAAGKTTFLLHLLRQSGARYLSNDRVLVAFADALPRLRGMPTIATIRPRTLDLLPEIAARLRTSGFRFRLSMAEIERLRPGPPEPGSDGKIGLSPAQLLRLVAAPPAASARAHALLLPRITHRPGTVELIAIAPEEAAAALEAALFGIHTWRKSSELFAFDAIGGRPDASELEARCARLTAAVPCYECRLGEEAYTEAGRWATEDALARLVGSP